MELSNDDEYERCLHLVLVAKVVSIVYIETRHRLHPGQLKVNGPSFVARIRGQIF
jgi:hypothetical protein